MAGELSQAQLEELVNGKQPKPTVVFYEKARLDVGESKRQGRRVYKTHVYVNERQAGITDWVAEKAQPHHFANYPDEYQIFLHQKKEVSPKVEIIPNINPAELQELIDMGLGTIERLATAKIVPQHLEKVWRSAKVLQQVLTENEDEQKESVQEGIKEDRIQADCKAIDVSQAVGQINGGNVERSKPQASDTGTGRKTAERIRQTRQVNGYPILSNDWSIQL